MTDYGPYATEWQAHEADHVQAAHAEARKAASPVGSHEVPNLTMLLNACTTAGVKVGVFDVQVLTWLAGLEAETCAVVAGLIVRAAGREG